MRADKTGPHRSAFEKNRRIVLQTQDVCGICGKPVDKSLKYPDPLSPVVDHIIPIDKGGHPSDLSNLQLAHMCCNRAKSDKLLKNAPGESENTVTNRNLPPSRDWKTYKRDENAQTAQ